MSGFEVAGVVLGTIPLLISALEHYKEGISTIRTWRNYDRELRSLIRNLETERVRFQDICEKLLVGLVSQCQIESMVDDPFGPAWHEERIRAKIQARLWRSFSNFEDIVKDMEEATKEMMTKLDLQPDGTVRASLSRIHGISDPTCRSNGRKQPSSSESSSGPLSS